MRKLQDFSEEEIKYMLKQARKVIENQVTEMSVPEDSPKKLLENGASFVSIHKLGELRGCIGNLEAEEPLILNIMKNAFNAAFNDPRFVELDEEEMSEIDIEISILTKPHNLEYSDSEDLLNKLNAPEDGVVLEKEGRSATFLPSVWEHFKVDDDYNKIGFLTELCLKAGLLPDDWKDAEISIYNAVRISEK